jgi:hypothetical protein
MNKKQQQKSICIFFKVVPLVVYKEALSLILFFNRIRMPSDIIRHIFHVCYSLDLECLPKALVLKAWPLAWCYWKVSEPLRGGAWDRWSDLKW